MAQVNPAIEMIGEPLGVRDHEERGAGLVEPLVVERDFSIIAVVGETMCRIPGIAGRVFSALGDRGVNIRAIAQGSSELNISFVVSREDHADAVLTVHDAFFAAAEAAVAGDPLVAARVRTGLFGTHGPDWWRMEMTRGMTIDDLIDIMDGEPRGPYS